MIVHKKLVCDKRACGAKKKRKFQREQNEEEEKKNFTMLWKHTKHKDDQTIAPLTNLK